MKNISSILTSAITGFIILAFSFAWLVILLVAMNGFTEKQAMPVLISHIVLSIVCVIAFGLVGVWIKNFIVRKKAWHVALSSAIAVVAASIAGMLVSGGGSLNAMFIASELISR